jgi:hypothetical protein
MTETITGECSSGVFSAKISTLENNVQAWLVECGHKWAASYRQPHDIIEEADYSRFAFDLIEAT